MPEHLPHTNCTQRETARPVAPPPAPSCAPSAACAAAVGEQRHIIIQIYAACKPFSHALSYRHHMIGCPVLCCAVLLPPPPPLRGAKETCFCHSPLKLASCRTKEAEMKPNGTSKTNLQNENATHTRNEGRQGEKE